MKDSRKAEMVKAYAPDRSERTESQQHSGSKSSEAHEQLHKIERHSKSAKQEFEMKHAVCDAGKNGMKDELMLGVMTKFSRHTRLGTARPPALSKPQYRTSLVAYTLTFRNKLSKPGKN